MKNIFLITLFIFLLFGCETKTENSSQNIYTSDIDNLWIAYDKITTTKDTQQQAQYLENLFLSKKPMGKKA